MEMSDNSFRLIGDTPPVPPKKRARLDVSSVCSTNNASTDSMSFCPENMHLVSVLRNDPRSKCLVLHTRFGDDLKEAIVTLQKSSFPNDADTLQRCKVVNKLIVHKEDNNEEDSCLKQDESVNIEENNSSFPEWQAKSIMSNDVYHRFLVTNGLESVNSVDMTVIYPAESHHFAKFTGSGRHIIQETPEMYKDVILPFLSEKPKDLTWIDNIIAGTAEQDRVLYTDVNEEYGFTLVLDYQWDGTRLQELHCLGIAHNAKLTCLRDLRRCHVPMLRKMLQQGRNLLSDKYSKPADISDNKTCHNGHKVGLSKDQILAYLHYPPTFYRLHVHFMHVDSGDSGTIAGRAHILEEIIRNLEQDDFYYANRTITIFSHDQSPMYKAICAGCPLESTEDSVTE
ncbi:unnamed protein product [Trichobilharzia szidati]|nr:unnamed protein product [Trichobilharzia szidati]